MQREFHRDVVATATSGRDVNTANIKKSIFSYHRVISTCTCSAVVNDEETDHRSSDRTLGGEIGGTYSRPSGAACLSSLRLERQVILDAPMYTFLPTKINSTKSKSTALLPPGACIRDQLHLHGQPGLIRAQ